MSDNELNELGDIFEDLTEDEATEDEATEEAPVVNFVTLVTPGGRSLTIGGVTEAITIEALLARAGVSVGADTVTVVDGTAVNKEFSVGPGATIALVSMQKAG